MSILRANLRLFWERSSLWTLYAFMLSVVGFLLTLDLMGMHLEDDLLPVLAAVVLPMGLIVGVMEVETLSCPFALTLPGHQSSVRQVVFLAGLVVSLSVMLIFSPGGPADGLILTLSATFSASLAVYLVGVGLTYIITVQGLTIIAPFACFFLAFLGLDWGIGAGVTHIILDFPVSVITAGSLATAVAWLVLGRPAWGLQIGTALRQWFSMRWNRGRVGKGMPADSASNPLLLRLVRASRGPSAAACIWGTLYAWMVPGGGRGQLVLTPIVALACAALASWYPLIGFLLIILLPFGFPRPSLYSRLLIAGGRKERFLAALVLLIIAGGVWTISVAVSFAAVDLVQAYLPQGQTRAANLEQIFPPVNIRLAVFLTALYPLRAFVDLAFQGLPTQGRFAGIVLFLFVYLPIIFTQRWLTGMPLVCVPFALVVSWLVSMYGLYQITMRRDLVIDRPDELDWSWLLLRHRTTELQRWGRE